MDSLRECGKKYRPLRERRKRKVWGGGTEDKEKIKVKWEKSVNI
jgi:hypothetical protein